MSVISKMLREEMLDKAKSIEKDINLLISPMRDARSNIHILKSDVDWHGTYVMELCGGFNGNGDWSKYLVDLSEIIKKISTKYDTWVIGLDNDVLDDIFYVKLGVREL